MMNTAITMALSVSPKKKKTQQVYDMNLPAISSQQKRRGHWQRPTPRIRKSLSYSPIPLNLLWRMPLGHLWPLSVTCAYFAAKG